MAEDTPSSDFYWDNIVIKVEDKLFCVPRFGLVQSSEVFADMFLLPSGPGANTEGQDREHPIILEGYKKDEFASLLKAVYPIGGSLISGTTINLRLAKEEWVNVLKLSTIWNMEKIRKYAIHRLSTDFVLSPREKIHLSRAYKVAAWLNEGITEFINGDPEPTLDDFATLGWENAARILWIMKVHSQSFMTTNILYFKGSQVKCGYCSSSDGLINIDYSCLGGHTVTRYSELDAPRSSTIPRPAHHVVQLQKIGCGLINCKAAAFSSKRLYCNSCSRIIGPTDTVRIKPIKGLKEMIEENFGDEIRNYKDPEDGK